MKFRQIEVFKAVMATGTVTAAAERLHVSQPAISQMLHDFEESLDVKLFDRIKGRLLPTTEASLFLEEVNRVYRGMEYLNEYAIALKDYRSRQLEIGVYTSALAGNWLSKILADFINIHPSVTITINDFNSTQVLKYTRSQQVDLGLSTLPISDPSVNCSLLLDIPAVCIIPENHPLNKKKIVCADDLKDQAFISLSDADNTKSQLNNFLEKTGVKPKTVIQASLSSSVCNLVSQGLGVAIIDSHSAKGHEHLPIVSKPFKSDISFNCYLVRPSSGRTSDLADSFIEHLKKSLNEEEKL